MTAVLATLLVAGAMHGAPASGTPAQSDDTCVIVRIFAEGRRTVIDEDHPDHDRYRSTRVEAGLGGTHASASSLGLFVRLLQQFGQRVLVQPQRSFDVQRHRARR